MNCSFSGQTGICKKYFLHFKISYFLPKPTNA